MTGNAKASRKKSTNKAVKTNGTMKTEAKSTAEEQIIVEEALVRKRPVRRKTISSRKSVMKNADRKTKIIMKNGVQSTMDEDDDDDLGDLLGLEPLTTGKGRLGKDGASNLVNFMDDNVPMNIERVKVACHMTEGADLMKRGFSNIVPIAAYGVVMTSEKRVDYPDSPVIEMDYELVSLMTKVFDMKTLFLVLDEVMEKLEDYTPHIELV